MNWECFSKKPQGSLVKRQRHKWLSDRYTVSHQEQALDHNHVQFWASLIAASVAFGLGIGLIAFVGYGLFALGLSWQVAAVETLISLALKAVSVLFFRQMNETRKHAVAMYDRVRFDEQTRLVIKFLETITDPSERGEVLDKIKPLLMSTPHAGR